MSIHYYVWLYLENEEEVEVEEENTSPPPPEEHQAGSYFYFDICGSEPDSPIKQGKPGACNPFLMFLEFLGNPLMHCLP
jgi:hypothetical protein